MVANHDPQDGLDAARRARLTSGRQKPIRFDRHTWLVMREDPSLPRAVITRQRTVAGVEYYRTVTWAIEAADRTLVGRFGTLEEADEAVHYRVDPPVVAGPDEKLSSFQARRQ